MGSCVLTKGKRQGVSVVHVHRRGSRGVGRGGGGGTFEEEQLCFVEGAGHEYALVN